MVTINGGPLLPCRRQDARNYTHRIRCDRWHSIAKDVGWLGVFCGDFIPAGIFDSDITNQHMFTRFLTFYSSKRKMMVEELMKRWPQAPACLRLVGGIYILYGLVDDIQTCRISLSIHSSHLTLISWLTLMMSMTTSTTMSFPPALPYTRTTLLLTPHRMPIVLNGRFHI